MKKAEVLKHFGGVMGVARALGIASPSVSQWQEDIPMLRAYQIERITEGKLKVNDPEVELKNAS